MMFRIGEGVFKDRCCWVFEKRIYFVLWVRIGEVWGLGNREVLCIVFLGIVRI